ncbi:hypothetical protein [Agromyces sp. SYSU T00194]|uniref:hypothetical protein n=1 Tax=Agromyces chitinivorans TaxID=3158560 RepID=UPI003399CA20
MTITVSRGCIVCGWESEPQHYEEGEETVLDASDHQCPVEPVARALCDAKLGEGVWDSWSTRREHAKYGRRARKVLEALDRAGLTVVPLSPTPDRELDQPATCSCTCHSEGSEA